MFRTNLLLLSLSDNVPLSREIRVGDQIKFWPPMNVAGDPSTKVRTTVTAIVDDAEVPLALSSGHILQLSTKVKKVTEGCESTTADDDDTDSSDTVSLDPDAPKYTSLSNYKLHVSGDGRHSDAIVRLSDAFTSVCDRKISKYLRDSTEDGCCLLDVPGMFGKKRL